MSDMEDETLPLPPFMVALRAIAFAILVFLVAVAIFGLAGCSDTFTRVGVSQQQADANLYACKRQNANLSDGSVVGPNGDFAQEAMVSQCMRARGYSVR